MSWTREVLFSDGDRFYEAILNAIANAKTSIAFEIYIFELDETGAEFEEALKAAAMRGVSVRLLVDGFGSSTWLRARKKIVRASGINLKAYHPIRFLSPTPLLFFSTLNNRDHRKLILVDDHIAFVGSFNISSNHRRSKRGDRAWRDTGLCLEGPEVKILNKSFDLIFNGNFLNVITHRLQPLFSRHNIGRRLRSRSNRLLTAHLREAKTRVWITTPYFAPSTGLLRWIRRAGTRGVDVRLLVPYESDVLPMKWIAFSFYRTLMSHGCKVFIYQPSFIHAKVLIIDDWMSVGTSNLNTRSLLKDLELDIVVHSVETKRQIEEQFKIDLSKSRELSLDQLQNYRWTERIGRWLAILLRTWI